MSFSREAEDRPILLLDIDLRDPSLPFTLPDDLQIDRLPLASYVNSNLWEQRQNYRFYNGTLLWENTRIIESNMYAVEDRIKSPLPSGKFHLVEMTEYDLPINEELYWKIGDEFLGGDKFIRILGSPYWLQDPVELNCACERSMPYFASIGYEFFGRPGLFTETAFFFGEAALYFFCCLHCNRISVISQST